MFEYLKQQQLSFRKMYADVTARVTGQRRRLHIRNEQQRNKRQQQSNGKQ